MFSSPPRNRGCGTKTGPGWYTEHLSCCVFLFLLFLLLLLWLLLLLSLLLLLLMLVVSSFKSILIGLMYTKFKIETRLSTRRVNRFLSGRNGVTPSSIHRIRGGVLKHVRVEFPVRLPAGFVNALPCVHFRHYAPIICSFPCPVHFRHFAPMVCSFHGGRIRPKHTDGDIKRLRHDGGLGKATQVWSPFVALSINVRIFRLIKRHSPLSMTSCLSFCQSAYPPCGPNSSARWQAATKNRSNATGMGVILISIDRTDPTGCSRKHRALYFIHPSHARNGSVLTTALKA